LKKIFFPRKLTSQRLGHRNYLIYCYVIRGEAIHVPLRDVTEAVLVICSNLMFGVRGRTKIENKLLQSLCREIWSDAST
jgi:hypothetical protein